MRYLCIFFLISSFGLSAEEMIIGKEKILPGIDITFEAAPKDKIYPEGVYLEESKTDIHIEMLATWSEGNKFNFPAGGFVPYMDVQVTIKNVNGEEKKVVLSPHINLIDSLHYAQNVRLPGKIEDTYEITFLIKQSESDELGIHYDWHNEVGSYIPNFSFLYKDLSFEKVALTERR